MSKQVYIKTYGCQMNVYDSGKMLDIVNALGYKNNDDIEVADLVILNTCHIREKATEKVYSELGKIRNLKNLKKAQGKQMLVAVAGCVSQAEGDEIFKRAPFVDIVVGPQTYHNLPELIAQASRNNKHNLNLEFPIVTKFDILPESNLPQGYSAFLTIQEGCDKFCKFCCVPYTRGAEYSRNFNEIYREALNLTSQGALEISLLGQNVSAYHGLGHNDKESNIAELIKYLAQIPKLKRVRYTTSHPKDMFEELAVLHRDEEKLMPFLHLPVQSGSDKILKHMNRKHTAQDYLDIIDMYKSYRPDMKFSSDFIVGYPGETEEDFQDTVELVKKVGFSQSYSFKYSPRPGTPAAAIDDQIPEEVKTDRVVRLQALLSLQQEESLQSSIGKKQQVMFEKLGKSSGQILGKNPYGQPVAVVEDDSLIGQIIEVNVIAVNGTTLIGKL